MLAHRSSSPRRFLLSIALWACAVAPLGAAKPGERETAARIDSLFEKAADGQPAQTGAVSDEHFLRRATLDLTGKLPSADEVEKFIADAAPDKRAALIDRLLASEQYAVNWGRYWRDTVTYHTPASGNYLRWQLFDQWWADQFRKNRPWNEVVGALVTAVGINDEQAPVNYLTSMFGNPVELAAVTSRVFLGVQIQCAECHDAKLEPFKREQFHELAAFFGRARIIQHKDVEGRGTPYAIEGRADGQYFMTDKKKPDRLLAVQPRFLTGESVPLEADDGERRAALARFLTSPKNPWFAKAYVNRMWNSLLGWGFYPTVADLGSDVVPQHQEVLELLTERWIESGYDTRWLFRTITTTRAYQSQQTATPSEDRATAVACVCPQRLRPEQVFEALQKALGFDEHDKTIPAPATTSAPAVQRHTGVRHMVYQAFKFNPSTPFDEVLGTIPQALVMMNSALVHTYTSAQGQTVLARMLAEGKSDDEIVAALYGKVLARQPTAEERQTCERYLKKVGDRQEALEDVLWTLINSTEFLLKK
ncbi:MAG: DUF1553 domain-containing protein [Planctomycetia bacterium]|nr:DUF1553 domain-containing protein [Planctomycetia bacterium]